MARSQRLKAERYGQDSSGRLIPFAVTRPSFTGTPDVGNTLTGQDGTWEGSGTVTVVERWWSRGGAAIPGATSSTYLVVAADAGRDIRFHNLARSEYGWDEAASDPDGGNGNGGGTARNGKQVGLAGINYFMGFSPFLNWMKVIDVLTIDRTAGGSVRGAASYSGGYQEATKGDLVTPVPADVVNWHGIVHARTFNVGENMGGEQFRVEWEGTGTLAVDFVSGGLVPDGPNAGTFTMGNLQDHVQIRAHSLDVNDPIQPSSVRIYQTRYQAEADAGEFFNPDWVSELRQFETVRLMDWPATNNNPLANFSQIVGTDFYHWGGNLEWGDDPKGGIPLEVVKKLAEATECAVWYCIPHAATDDYVTQVATYFRDNIPGVTIKYEYSNEVWNSIFAQHNYAATQGNAIWLGEPAHSRAWRWYGYRAAQIMKIIRDVYGVPNRSRWRGVLAAFTAVISTVEGSLIGIDHWRTSTGNTGLAVADLFDEVAVTSYFGGVVDVAGSVTAIAQGATTTFTAAEDLPVELQVGTRIIIAMNNCGMAQMDGLIGTVTARTTTTFTLNINSTGFSAFVPGSPNPYWSFARIFDLINDSASAFPGDPYRGVIEDFVEMVETGISPSGLMPAGGTLPDHISTPNGWWVQHKAFADAHGLDLTQYEGGSHFVGNVFLNGFPDFNELENRFTPMLKETGHRSEMAALYTRFAEEFVALGGKEPSKFVEGALASRFGTWAGVRFWPSELHPNGDLANPVWQAVKARVDA